MRKRRAQIAGAVEATEGTAETLDAGDVVLCFDPEFVPNIEMHDRRPARAIMTPLAKHRGVMAGTISFGLELKGSGAVGTDPAFDPYLRACGFVKTAIKSIGIGAVTGGPFLPGEIVTGGTSSATARVVGQTANGASVLKLVELSGTLVDAETLTGGTSGATATSSGTPTAAQGFEWLPTSDETLIPSLTLALRLDGKSFGLVAARGDVTFEGRVGESVMMRFSFQGRYVDVTDTGLFSGVTYESTVPVMFKAITSVLYALGDTEDEASFTEVDLRAGNTVSLDRSAGYANGVRRALLPDRVPTGRINPLAVLEATEAFWGALEDGTEGRLYLELPGATAGEKIAIACPAIEIGGNANGDRDDQVVSDLEFNMVSALTDTVELAMQLAMF